MRRQAVNRIIFAILPMLLFMCGLPGISHGQGAPDNIVQFSDRSLAIMVHINMWWQIGVPPPLIELLEMPEAEVLNIPKAALAKLTNLLAGTDLTDDLRLPEINDLAGLDHAVQLRSLDLSDQNITDLTPLSELTQLRELDLAWCNTIIDITPLAQLTQLTELNLGRNKIVHIAPPRATHAVDKLAPLGKRNHRHRSPRATHTFDRLEPHR